MGRTEIHYADGQLHVPDHITVLVAYLSISTVATAMHVQQTQYVYNIQRTITIQQLEFIYVRLFCPANGEHCIVEPIITHNLLVYSVIICRS